MVHGRTACLMNEVELLGPAEIRVLAEQLNLSPTKKLGQNFVIDANTVRKIVNLANIRPGDQVVEIGPGLGSLSLGILAAGASLVAIEIDQRLATQLEQTCAQRAPHAPVTIIHQDALTIQELPGNPSKLVANLPYNISVPVLLHFMEHFPSIGSGIVMVQAEVGQRIASLPGSKIYGAPSVKAAWYGTWRIAGHISRQVFWPVPNVDSVLVSFEKKPHPGDTELRLKTFALIDAAFGQRRKMLRQSLSSLWGSAAQATAILEKAGIDPTHRGEQLSLADFVSIAQAG